MPKHDVEPASSEHGEERQAALAAVARALGLVEDAAVASPALAEDHAAMAAAEHGRPRAAGNGAQGPAGDVAHDMTEAPVGRRDLVCRLFDAFAPLLAERPEARLRVLQVKEMLGRLRFSTSLSPASEGPVPALSSSIQALVAETEDASALFGDRWGGLGSPRARTGWLASRRDASGVDDAVALETTDEMESADPPDALFVLGAEQATAGGGKRYLPRALRGSTGPHLPDGTRRIALYALDDVEAAAGARPGSARTYEDVYEGDLEEREPPASRSSDTEQQARLQEIIDAGEEGRWRHLAGVPKEALDALGDLARRAPHMDAMTALVERHLRAAATIGLPVSLPPVLLLGEPGVGKSWYLSRLATALGLPHRSYPMNLSTLGEGLGGSHPSWRNSAPGLVAKTLLRERVANPLILVDEFDKAQANGWNRDPYTAFYSLLDPSNAKAFVDEYLQFPMDASGIAWVLAGNDASLVPAPIMDRLTVLTLPAMSPSHLATVCRSIYEEANAARLGFFDPELADAVVDRLLDLNPRSLRIVLEDALVTAAAGGRRTLSPDDVRPRERRAARSFGFGLGSGR